MSISNDSLPIPAGILTNTAQSMTTVMKYIYTVSYDDFYNINIKDIFRVALLDVTKSSSLENLGIAVTSESSDGIFESPEFQRLPHMIAYSFAARLPFFKRQIEDFPLTDKQLKTVYDIMINNGADNFGGMIYETYEENMKLQKQKQLLPSFNSEWVRRYIYTYMPRLGEINNRNLYFMGCIEAMFPLYYSSVVAQLKKVLFLLNR